MDARDSSIMGGPYFNAYNKPVYSKAPFPMVS